MELPADAEVRSCYEAGREGFSVHRKLVQLGVHNVVIDAASVDVSRRARRAKTDRLDAEMLVAKLIAHHRGERVFAVARVPSPDDEGSRHEQRLLGDLKVERGRHRVRIRALLLTEGIVTWLPSSAADLTDLRTVDGRPLSPGLLRRIQDEVERLEFAQQQITRIEAARKTALAKEVPTRQVQHVKLLSSLKGIGTTGAFQMVLECFGWRTFSTRREVAGCLGLAPSPFASGKIDHEQGISKLGNPRLRALLIELSWLWLRYQPTSRISLWFQEKFAQGAGRSRRIGIVAVARKLAIALWKLIEFGVVPEGAVMKT
jgi:transposase